MITEGEVYQLRCKIKTRLHNSDNLSLDDAVILNKAESVLVEISKALWGPAKIPNKDDTNGQATMKVSAKILIELKEKEEHEASRSGEHAKALAAQAQSAVLRHILISMGERL